MPKKVKIKGRMKKSDAYWVSPDMIAIPVPMKHIDVVTDEPEKFGKTTPELKKVYKKYKEPYGHEGKAREDIMASLIKDDNWIRLRYIPRGDLWVAQISDIPSTKDALTAWAKAAEKHWEYSDMSVLDTEGNQLYKGPLEMVAVDELYDKKYAPQRQKSALAAFREDEEIVLTFVESIADYKKDLNFNNFYFNSYIIIN
jgi:hypothetical protein